jgi:sortase A
VLAIPTLGIRTVVREGTGEAVLARGPGFYAGSGRPGCGCTIAIAGHRVTPVPGFDGHGPFRWLNRLVRGARIYLRIGGRTTVYAVSGSEVLSPSDVAPLADIGHERLVLSTCTPPFSATYRLVVFALPVR